MKRELLQYEEKIVVYFGEILAHYPYYNKYCLLSLFYL